MTKKRPRASARTERRTAARDAQKLWALREKLLLLEDGGSPSRPRAVASASVIEPEALDASCARCETPVRVVEHNARIIDGMRLREVVVACPKCALRRSLWFKIVADAAN